MSEQARKLYAVAYYAGNLITPVIGLASGYGSAHDLPSAKFHALEKCKEIFPDRDGWVGHQVSVTEIETEGLQQ